MIRTAVQNISGRSAFAFVEDEGCLFPARPFPLSWFGDRGDEFCAATALDNPLGGLSLSVEFPVLLWALIRGVQIPARRVGRGYSSESATLAYLHQAMDCSRPDLFTVAHWFGSVWARS